MGNEVPSRSAILFTLPTVGHVNHGVALASLMARANVSVCMCTGAQARTYAESLGLPFRLEFASSYDLEFDKRVTSRPSHFRQIFHPDHFERALETARRLVAETSPAIIVTKDFVAPRLAAIEADLPC